MKHNKQTLLSRISNPKYIMVYATVGIFLIIYLFGALLYGDKGFTTLRTFVNMFIDNAYYGISAVGMTMVLITGGIDLSVGAVASSPACSSPTAIRCWAYIPPCVSPLPW